jgi:hypothetical protein
VDFNNEEIHDVAGVLKQYIRELPDPLCGAELYPYWLEAFGIVRGQHQSLTS